MDTEQKEKKSWKNGSERYRKYQMLRDAGVSIGDAGRTVGYQKDYPYHVERKYQKFLLTHPQLIKKANKFIHHVLDSGLEGKEEYINPATTLTREIYDRVEPKVQKIEQDTRSVSVEITADVSDWADTVLESLGFQPKPPAEVGKLADIQASDAPDVIDVIPPSEGEKTDTGK